MKFAALSLFVIGVANAGTVTTTSSGSSSGAGSGSNLINYGNVVTPVLGAGQAGQLAHNAAVNGW